MEDGTPCCDWMGDNGAGHFVKMVHNGIEYGDMQLICEAYHLMRDVLGMSAEEMHEAFKGFNETDLDSYLIEITRDISPTKTLTAAPGGQDSRHRRAEGDRQVDERTPPWTRAFPSPSSARLSSPGAFPP